MSVFDPTEPPDPPADAIHTHPITKVLKPGPVQLRTKLVPRKVSPRFMAVQQFYVQPTRGEATGFRATFGRNLGTEEEPYRRTMPIGPEWVKLDTGWLKDDKGKPLPIAYVVILCEDGTKRLDEAPTDEQRIALRSRTVQRGKMTEAGTIEPVDDIPPGESCSGRPTDVDRIYLRCLTGQTRCLILVVPE